MAPKLAPKRRPAPDLVPDSLPGKEEPDALPDDLRRQDQSDTPPDSLPPREKDLPLEGRDSLDGGVSQHPIHAGDLEDLGPEDYEEQIEKAEENSLQEHPEGSAPPLDRLTQDRKPEPDSRS